MKIVERPKVYFGSVSNDLPRFSIPYEIGRRSVPEVEKLLKILQARVYAIPESYSFTILFKNYFNLFECHLYS